MQDITDMKPWTGASSGRFHLDFLGVKTDPRFFSGLSAAKPGRISVSLPSLSEFYLEYCALVMAATYERRRRGFRVIEVGAAWGLWVARAVALGRRLGLPTRSVAVEPLPAQLAQLRRHYLTNGIDPACNAVEEAVLGESAGEPWLRFSHDTDLSARVVPEDWAMTNAVVPLLNHPRGLPLACRDGSRVMRVRQRAYGEVVPAGKPVDFLHVRVGPGPDRVLDAQGFDAGNIGVVVLPSLNPVDAPRVEKRLAARGFTELLYLPKGHVLRTPRGEVVLRGALRIHAGALVSPKDVRSMTETFARLCGLDAPVQAGAPATAG